MQYMHIWGWVPTEPWGSSSREMAKLTTKDSTWLLGHCLISNPSWVLVFSFCKMELRYTERVMAFVRGRCGCGTDPWGPKECRGLDQCLKSNPQTGVQCGRSHWMLTEMVMVCLLLARNWGVVLKGRRVNKTRSREKEGDPHGKLGSSAKSQRYICH